MAVEVRREIPGIATSEGMTVVPMLIEKTCRSTKEAGIRVGMCGEAAYPGPIPRLVGMGITEPDIGALSIIRVDRAVSGI